MHLFLLKENLDKALFIISRIIPSRPQLPILSNILLKTDNSQLKIFTTNLELGIIFTLNAKIEKQGEVAIPGRLFVEFINSLAADKIEFLLEGTNFLVKTNYTQTSFTTSNPNDFPPFPSFPQIEKTFPLIKLKEAIKRCVFAASIDETRPVLTGVNTTFSSGKITFVATDGYRLSKEEIKEEKIKEELKAILPATSLFEVVRIASELKEEEVGFLLIEGKNQIVFSFPQVTLFTRLIEGEFPQVEKIIPLGFKTRVMVEKDLLLSSVKTVSLFARGAANIIKMKIKKEGMELSANTPQIGEDKEIIEAKTEGEEIEVAFNYRFLLDLLNNFPDKELVFESAGPLSPGVFKPTSPNISFLHLIMPVRVQG